MPSEVKTLITSKDKKRQDCQLALIRAMELEPDEVMVLIFKGDDMVIDHSGIDNVTLKVGMLERLKQELMKDGQD